MAVATAAGASPRGAAGAPEEAGAKLSRNFDIYLEKRRLAKRPKSLDTARGMSLYEGWLRAPDGRPPRELLACQPVPFRSVTDVSDRSCGQQASPLVRPWRVQLTHRTASMFPASKCREEI
ncbi:hypothetical protein H8959_003138 [Pygathrix nigripes]